MNLRVRIGCPECSEENPSWDEKAEGIATGLFNEGVNSEGFYDPYVKWLVTHKEASPEHDPFYVTRIEFNVDGVTEPSLRPHA